MENRALSAANMARYCLLLGADTIKGYSAYIHDMQATLLHALGIDHTRLTYRYQGRDFRLTDVHGNVVKPLLA